MFVDVAYYVPTENHVAINTSLLTVSATDKDVTAEFNKVVYSIKDGQNGSSFSVDKDTGTIRTKIILANPNPVNLTLTAVATDNNNSTFTDEACVTVCLGCKTSDSSAPGITCFASMTLVFGVILM